MYIKRNIEVVDRSINFDDLHALHGLTILITSNFLLLCTFVFLRLHAPHGLTILITSNFLLLCTFVFLRLDTQKITTLPQTVPVNLSLFDNLKAMFGKFFNYQDVPLVNYI